MATGPIGIAANPASGKDVRRLVARASVFDNQEKCAIIRRAIVGAMAASAREFRFLPDTHGITEAALEEFSADLHFEPVDSPATGSALDTTRAALGLKEAGCAVVITLGGDGTNRAFALGWRDAPLLPVSTGTNNVFPRFVEATIAGAAAGLIATGAVALEEVAKRAKTISVEIEDEKDDLALIDAVLTRQRFVGSRALLDADQLQLALLTRAEPSAVGITAIGGLLQPVSQNDDHGLLLKMGKGDTICAPIAPGLYQDVSVRSVSTTPFGQRIAISGPGVLAFDGERERSLKPGQKAWFRLERNGPWVIDTQRTLELAACRGVFRRDSTGETNAH
jgi:predicted polyphosphate/ATP-dependent NAD kinase